MNNLINRIHGLCFTKANSIIKQLSGIVNFFDSEESKNDFITTYEVQSDVVCEDRVSYGDWQTPPLLAKKVCESHIERCGTPDVVIEPTCGLGSFVFASLESFPNLSEIHAVEINREYTSTLKLNILLNALSQPIRKYPDIYIYTDDFFKFDFSNILNKCKLNNWNLAILGNPPWVTNSTQGRNNSNNLPIKWNSLGLKGLDAITGKSNFDISEYITLHLLELSQFNKGGISFLLKNSVIRNILTKQRVKNIHVENFEQRLIDASSEFNVSVNASCLSATFDGSPSLTCTVKDFYSDKCLYEYGWIGDSFVSDTKLYNSFSKYDRTSTYIWRSGIKHDCASVLELTLDGGAFVNGLGEVVEIEDDIVFPLIKSSDVRKYHNTPIRKYIIVPQQKMGTDTSVLKETHPKAYTYLTKHEWAFNKRKSSIYRDQDKFSIFGIGDYSFSKYKIVVSSLYKTISFILVSQYEGKPILVDDTCYQLDFNNYEEAKIIYDALNSKEIQSLLCSLIFKDAKRVVTKSLLMRLDVVQLCIDRGIIINTERFISNMIRQPSLFD
ncbi:MAG: SAM-dependent methyltransferase [Bacteroides sp.]|nr:SAM-dependent methyltransferase [Bacteroides sp.]